MVLKLHTKQVSSKLMPHGYLIIINLYILDLVNVVNAEHTLTLTNYSYGTLLHLNYPQSLPNMLNFTEHLVAPLGHIILLEIYSVGFSENRCPGGGTIKVLNTMVFILHGLI